MTYLIRKLSSKYKKLIPLTFSQSFSQEYDKIKKKANQDIINGQEIVIFEIEQKNKKIGIYQTYLLIKFINQIILMFFKILLSKLVIKIYIFIKLMTQYLFFQKIVK